MPTAVTVTTGLTCCSVRRHNTKHAHGKTFAQVHGEALVYAQMDAFYRPARTHNQELVISSSKSEYMR